MANHGAVNPFPGYRPFAEDDAGWYFGREREADALDARLASARVLAVVGPAEHGKSSLVLAGVIPRVRLRKGRVAVLRPGQDPVSNLARALSAPGALGQPVDLLNQTLRKGPEGLAECVREANLSPDQDLLVVVDQLDELFRYRRCRDLLGTASDDERFVALVVAANREKSGVRVLFTLRTETVEECRAYPALYEAVREPFELHAMTEDQLRDAIEKPISEAKGHVSRMFVDSVVQAFEPKRVPSQLPLIQHAVMRAWDARVRADEALDVRHLAAVGGVPQALFTHADKVCAADPKPELVDKVVRCLTAHEGGHFVPRPATIGEVARMCEVGVEAIEGVVRRLQAPGVTFLKPSAIGTLGEGTIVDVSYDSFAWIRRHRWSYQSMPVINLRKDVKRPLPVHPHVAAAPHNWRLAGRYLWPALLTLTTLTVMTLAYPRGPTTDTPPFCGSGQLPVSLGGERFDCAPKPACAADQIIVSGGDGAAFGCRDLRDIPPEALPICAEGIRLGLGGDQFECVTPPPCPNGQIAYGQPNGPVRCLTSADIELRVCGVNQILTGPVDGPFICGEGPPPNVNFHIGCLVVVGPTGGPLSCVAPPPTPTPTPFPCKAGEIQVGLGGGASGCVTQPPCRDDQIAYGQVNGPFLCMTPVIIERLVCGERSRLVGPVGDEFLCEPGSSPSLNVRIDCRILAGPAGGPLRCSAPPLPALQPNLPSCSPGQIPVATGRGVFRCGNLPVIPAPLDVRCPDGEWLVRLKDGQGDCKPVPRESPQVTPAVTPAVRPAVTPPVNPPPFPCGKGEIQISLGGGKFECRMLPVIPDARCPDGEMLVGLGLKKDGKADCKPIPPGPSLQFADLSRVAPGFVYQLEENTWLTIAELDLRLKYCTVKTANCPNGRRLQVTDGREGRLQGPPDFKELINLDGLVPEDSPAGSGKFDVEFKHGDLYFRITLGPGRQAVVRRCSGAPCGKLR